MLFRSLGAYESARDLVDIGAYVAGSNPAVDRALRLMPRLRRFLQQPPDERSSLEETLNTLERILSEQSTGEESS